MFWVQTLHLELTGEGERSYVNTNILKQGGITFEWNHRMNVYCFIHNFCVRILVSRSPGTVQIETPTCSPLQGWLTFEVAIIERTRSYPARLFYSVLICSRRETEIIVGRSHT